MSDSLPSGERDANRRKPLDVQSPTGDATPRVIRSDALLAGQSQLAIVHNETIYFLRQTRFGKLILTK